MAESTNGLPVLFDGKELSVHYSAFGKERVFITFTSWGRNHVTGFGQNFFRPRSESGIYFISKRDHWWQPEEVRAAVNAVRAYIDEQGYGRVITYGASMGGYGAAVYSKDLRADLVITIAPQFTIDPKKQPFETRWTREAKKLTFLYDDMDASLSPTARKVILFDPLTADLNHARLFCKHPNVELITVPFGGHVPGKMLLQIGNLKDTVFDIVEGAFDRLKFVRAIKAGRRQSSIYWTSIFEHAQKRHPKVAYHALEKALSLSPTDLALRLRLIYLDASAGRLEAAFRQSVYAVTLAPQHPASWRALSTTATRLDFREIGIEAARRAISLRADDADLRRVLFEGLLHFGMIKEAIGAGREAIALAPNYAPTYSRLARTFASANNLESASAMARKALELAPDNKQYQQHIAELAAATRAASVEQTPPSSESAGRIPAAAASS